MFAFMLWCNTRTCDTCGGCCYLLTAFCCVAYWLFGLLRFFALDVGDVFICLWLEGAWFWLAACFPGYFMVVY